MITVSLDNVRSMIAALRGILVLHEGGRDTAVSSAVLEGFPSNRSWVTRFPVGPVSRGSAIVRTENAVVVLLAGVNSTTANTLLRGYASIREMRQTDGLNVAAVNEAIRRFLGVLDTPPFDDLPTYVYGHSGGGVVAEAIRQLAQNRRWDRVRQVVTFGAPKRGLGGLGDEGSDVPHCRVVTIGDPVPAIPFYGMAHGNPLLLAMSGYRDAFAACRQSSDGLIVSQGSYDDSLRRNIVGNPDPYTEALAWGTFPDHERIHPHRIESYLRELYRLESSLVDEETKRVSQLPPPVWIAREFNLDGINTSRGLPSPPPSTVPGASVPVVWPTLRIYRGPRGVRNMPTTRIPHAMKPVHQNIGGQWRVVWMGSVIGTFPTATKARTFARGLYRGARTMLGASSITANELLAAWSTFMQAASTEGSGIRPTINVV